MGARFSAIDSLGVKERTAIEVALVGDHQLAGSSWRWRSKQRTLDFTLAITFVAVADLPAVRDRHLRSRPGE